MTFYIDDKSGISVDVNPSAFKSKEQGDAIADFMKTLAGIPTQSEMEKWVKNYDKFSELLKDLQELDKNIKEYCAMLKRLKCADEEFLELRINADCLEYLQYREVETRKNVVEVKFK